MSDSDLSEAEHSPNAIGGELRKIVRDIYASGNLEDLTVKRVRLAAEKSLGLEEGFYKQDAWKEKSKAIIEAEAKNQDQTQASPPSPKKRKAVQQSTPSKRQKKTKDEAKPITKRVKKISKTKSALSSDLSEPEDSIGRVAGDRNGKNAPEASTRQPEPAGDVSESELSELIDEEPQPKRKSKKSAKTEKPTKGKPKSAATKKTKETPELDPEAAEIKRLQSWLIKCGIRKMWGRELKPYDTPKAKIKHLREMLSEAGMTGRYSVEKASQIREARELQADLEAVQEGAKYWGKKESDEEEDVDPRPKRRLAKGLQELAAFGDSESD